MYLTLVKWAIQHFQGVHICVHYDPVNFSIFLPFRKKPSARYLSSLPQFTITPSLKQLLICCLSAGLPVLGISSAWSHIVFAYSSILQSRTHIPTLKKVEQVSQYHESPNSVRIWMHQSESRAMTLILLWQVLKHQVPHCTSREDGQELRSTESICWEEIRWWAACMFKLVSLSNFDPSDKFLFYY